jgi:hypothetical protein
MKAKVFHKHIFDNLRKYHNYITLGILSRGDLIN